MNTPHSSSDLAILNKLGHRLTQVRIRLNLTQADLAKKSGVSKRTVENLENGASVTLRSLVRVMRALDLLGQLEELIPDVAESPLQQLRDQKSTRKRASKTRMREPRSSWKWGDEE